MKVFVSLTSFSEFDRTPLILLKAAGFDVLLNPYKRKLHVNEIIEFAKGCQGIIAGTEPLTKQVLKELPGLKAISRCGVGLDNVDMEAAGELGIKVQITPNAPTESVAELTVALILNILRRISLMDKQVHSGTWNKEVGWLLSEKTIGVIGLGRIGKRVAELLRPFNVKLLISEPKPDKKWIEENNARLTTLDQLLKESDIVTLHIPYLDDNHFLINAEKLKLMKKNSILINTSRGGLVNENALYLALKQGNLAGAALDVMEAEPYDGPLKELGNVILTPHIGSYALEARVQMEIEATKNLIEILTEGVK